MERLFQLKEHNTNVKTELIAGITTFLSMVYILAVNPSILSAAGMDSGAVFTATAISAGLATLCMAFFANYPIALASGMGLNAYFASVCMELNVDKPWEIVLAAIFFEGIIFLLLSFTNFREKLVNDIPQNLKYGISVGIGLFIAIVGLQNAGIVVDLSLGDMKAPSVALPMIGFLFIAFLQHKKVTGSILWGILATWLLGMAAQAIGWYEPDPEAGLFSLYPNFSFNDVIPAAPYLFDFNFAWIGENILHFAVIAFAFLYADIFDTVGALIGIGEKGNFLDDKGQLPRAKQALLSDAAGTTVGACLGTSTVTSYIESAIGVGAGGRTGLTSVVTGVLFLLSLFLSPLFLSIPGFATTPALLYVGLLMISSITNIRFEGTDIADSVAAFMAIIMMPFTSSIANGIMLGILSWVILKVCQGKAREIPAVMWISGVIFLLYIFV